MKLIVIIEDCTVRDMFSFLRSLSTLTFSLSLVTKIVKIRYMNTHLRAYTTEKEAKKKEEKGKRTIV